ncbi:PREDICTED: putative nuclease HARBI1 [Erythranthe guttata]|uniref:putative nuclease HARBI1 n=1 Tax=Erythranthe guttata TaxID=4155 RepID=UPI00064D9AB0|nr:PREDICTED: putative nuclease HARBI1 [Erythranthe guttata]|eukprot:XP_012847430.1 PREDICTED: putative nuclease HARBI1 [Erythranthe guttata]
MDINAFVKLSYLLQHVGGLEHSRFVSVHEQVALFLQVLAHHKKNRIVSYDFKRSGQTVSKYFNKVLAALLKLHPILLVTPKPIGDAETNENWKHFKGCLGAADGTFIKVRVELTEKPKYRSRKGEIAVNVLGVCDRNCNFIYILSGWEGSAADSRVLRDAVMRPNGFKVPSGNYYLCDGGYMNTTGFLTPYRGIRYHLKEWGEGRATPQNFQEYFNMKHSRARNVIEKAFGLLKTRWAALRSNTFYPIKVQNRIIMACALVHNFIRTNMEIDPWELEVGDIFHGNEDDGFISSLDPSVTWNNWRDNLANDMFTQYRHRRGA